MSFVRRSKAPYFVRPRTAILTSGFDPALSVGSARPAVFRSSTYVFSSPEAAERAFAVALGRSRAAAGENIDLIYARLSHPNAEILEDQIVPLEPGATAAAVFNSGMAAISTLFLHLCPPGSSFIYTTPLYGGTQHLIHELLEPLGLRGIPAPAGNSTALANAIAGAADLRLVLVETPANPTLIMTDIAAVAAAIDRRGGERPILAVDNTFLGPVFQHPLLFGADVSLYSATKFLGGHSDVLGGVALSTQVSLIDGLRGLRAVLGNILQPDECWLLDGRLPSVDLRMTRQSKNAERIADALARHPRVRALRFPSHFTDPAELALYRKQCKGPGSIVTLDLGDKAAAFDFLRRLTITKNAVSLGGVESLACHPATTTHSELSEAERADAGIGPGLVRISCGVEDARDLLAEYQAALDAL